MKPGLKSRTDQFGPMKTGEIWVVELPVLGGYEQHGTRPVIVVGDPALSVVLIVPLTTNHDYLKFSHTVLMNFSTMSGLDKDSVALVFQLRAIDKRRFRNKIGQLSLLETKMIKKTMAKLLGLTH